MNLWGIMPNYNEVAGVKSANKSTAAQLNNSGPSFVESIGEIARSANMQIASGATAGELRFARHKEGFEKHFSYKEEEKVFLDDRVTRISELFNQLKK